MNALRNHFKVHGVIHLWWIIAVLLAVIAGLIVRSPGGELMYNYTSFAAAIASILLAMVAIIYAFIANQSFSDTIVSMSKAGEEVGQHASTLRELATDFFRGIDNLSTAVQSFPDSVKTVSSEITQRLDLLAEKPRVTEGAKTPATDLAGDVNIDSISIPVGCSIALYCMAMSKKHNKTFSTKELGIDSDYITGALLGCLSIISASQAFGSQVSRVGTNFFTRDMGRLPIGDVLRILDPEKSDLVKGLRESIDLYFSLESAATVNDPTPDASKSEAAPVATTAESPTE